MKYPSSYTGSEPRENPIHESHHVPEMHDIAIEEINRHVPQIVHQEAVKLINEAVQGMIGAIRYDVETTLEISFKDLGEMYKDTKVRKFISDAICKKIEQRLRSITIK